MPATAYIVQAWVRLKSGERLLLKKTCATSEEAIVARDWVASSFDALEADETWAITGLDNESVVRLVRSEIASITVGIYS